MKPCQNKKCIEYDGCNKIFKGFINFKCDKYQPAPEPDWEAMWKKLKLTSKRWVRYKVKINAIDIKEELQEIEKEHEG